MTAPAPPAPPRAPPGVGKHFGRFELQALLGKSERTMVWRVRDPASRQELMLTLPRQPPADDAALQRFVREAQQALRLRHPRLAAAAEVGAHERWPYVAVDRRVGISVDEWLERHPRPAAQVVAGWLSQLLDGLAFAHEAGTSHGDLQRHSVLIDEQGNASLMALGGAADGVPGATPHEQLRRHRDAAERDVLAAGLLLHHLLAGQPALDDADTLRVIHRIAPLGREVVRLPWATPLPVPDALRVIANRATASEPRQRYLNARTLLRALQGWVETEGQDRGGPLALLLERLASVGHLPAMPGVAARVARLAGREGQHTAAIAEEIMQDMALSFELLRQVNVASVRNAQFGGGAPVLTIRRCVALLGLNGVKRAAASLRRWPGPLAEPAAQALDKTVQLVRLAALTAQRLRPAGYDPEVVYLVTVVQNLGRLLVHYHFPDEAAQIRQLMLPAPPATGGEPGRAATPGMSEPTASLAVLGVDSDALGHAVARHWALGDEVLHMALRLSRERPVPAADDDVEMLRITASAANEAVDAMAAPGTPQRKVMAMAQVAQRYARVLDLTPQELQRALQDARDALQGGPGAAVRGVAAAAPA